MVDSIENDSLEQPVFRMVGISLVVHRLLLLYLEGKIQPFSLNSRINWKITEKSIYQYKGQPTLNI